MEDPQPRASPRAIVRSPSRMMVETSPLVNAHTASLSQSRPAAPAAAYAHTYAQTRSQAGAHSDMDDDDASPRKRLERGTPKLDEDEEQTDSSAMTEEERDAIAMRCLRLISVLLMLLGAGVTGGALYASTQMLTSANDTPRTLSYVFAGVGGALLAVSTLGTIAVCRKPHVRLLLIYYTCLTVLGAAAAVVGGYAFVLTDSSVKAVLDRWDNFLASLPPDKRGAFTRDSAAMLIRGSMYACGGVCIIMAMLCAGGMNHATRLLTPVRAYTILLQATNVALLPVGVAMIGVAAFVADTAVGAEASVAAFSLFILGVFVLCLLLLGCAGTSLHSRGIIRAFMLLTGLLGLGFLAFGALALVQADALANFITAQWDYVRRVLPPDFSGRYDREQFSIYVSTNLTAMGFLALCAGMLQVAQTWASYRLRAELRLESELEQEAFEAADKGLVSRDVAETIARARDMSGARRMWKQQWTKGTKWSRRIILCSCITGCTLVFAAVGLAAAALYYNMSCTAITTFADTNTFGGADMGPFVFVQNNYTLGRISVSVNTSATTRWTSLTYRKAAYKPEMAQSTWPSVETRNVSIAMTTSSGGVVSTSAAAAVAVSDTVLGVSGSDILGSGVGSMVTANGIVTTMRSPTSIIGYDVSCQNSEVTVSVPSAVAVGGQSRAAGDATPLALELASPLATTAVAVDFSGAPAGSVPRIRRMQLITSAGPIDVKRALIGSKGMHASTTSGEISIVDTRAECDPMDLGDAAGGLRMQTDKGAITISNITTLDCDVVLVASAAMSRIASSTFSNSFGGATISVTGNKGVIQVQDTTSDIYDIKGDEGSVRVNNVTVREALKVASSSGLVSLQRLRVVARGSVQVETDSGSIEIWASQFAGIISVVSGGRISCIGSGFDDTTPCAVVAGGTVDSAGAQTLSIVEQVTVNCRGRGDCAYLGQLSVTSTRGNVLLRMDAWTR